MVQKLINDTEENKFYSVWLQLFQQTMADLQDYYNLVYESQLLGGLIFDNQLSEMAKIINRELFIKTYWQIFNEETKNGTVDAHMYLLYAIFKHNDLAPVGHKTRRTNDNKRQRCVDVPFIVAGFNKRRIGKFIESNSELWQLCRI